ncbi:MAG: hypothetical protein ACXWWD_13070, partial [Chitinophagaceae bacterium]
IIMLLALLWLMLGAPILHIELQKQLTKISSPQNTTDEGDQNSYPFDAEENTELNPAAFTFEYLQIDPSDFTCMDGYLKHNKSHYPSGLLILQAEMFSPPPEYLS